MKKNEFKNPSVKYRSIPFWAWNDKMDKDEIKRQIYEMSHCGMGGFFMHSRDGLETEYLSDEWFECIKTAVEEAKKLGMKAWLYDEDRWPSGSCGGKVTKDGKGCKGLTLEVCESVPNEEVLALYAAETRGMDIYSLRRIDTDHKINENEKILVARLETSASSEWFNFSPPPDNLSLEEVGEFINSTHEKYKQHIGEYFGETVCGIFTDEPSLADRHASFNPKRGWLPWTDDFAEYYISKRGTDIFETLPYIYFNHEKSAKARFDFWHTVSEMFLERYSMQIASWCKENGIAYTGHFLQEDKLGLSCRVSGSIMPHYAMQDIPAIDLLTDRTEEYLTVKQCTSVASQMGKDMVLSEMYGCTGWDFDFEGQKRIAEWQYVLGINQRCQHLALYSLRGCRKRDYPPSINCNAPWWEEYRTIEDYFVRLGYVLRQGKRVENVLVIHPMSTVWSRIGCNPYGNPIRKEERDVPAMNKLGDKLNELIKWLCHNHYGCELGDETIIAEHGSVKNGKFIIGQAEYDIVMIPFSETLFDTTKKLLIEFENQGGKVVCGDTINQKPLVSITDNDGREITDILYQLRKTNDGYILYIVNTSKEKSHRAKIDFDGKVYKLNPMNGNIYHFDISDGFCDYFPPCGSSLFYITDNDIDADVYMPLPALTDGVTPSLVGYSTDKKNVLTLDKCRYTLNNEKSKLKEVWQSQCEVREKLEMRQINLNGIEQRYRWIGKPHKNNGTQVILEFPFSSLCNVTDAELVIERGEDFGIYLDGKKIDNKPIGHFFDKSFERVPLPSFEKGNHIITLKCRYRNDFELENIYLTGEFGVNTAREITPKPKSLNLGDITKQGYFHYAGAMEYSFEYDMKDKSETYLDVTDFKGICASAFVNGKEIKIPWRSEGIIRIDNLMNIGHNEIKVKVFTGFRNMLGPLHLKNKPTVTKDSSFCPTGDNYTEEYIIAEAGLYNVKIRHVK